MSEQDGVFRIGGILNIHATNRVATSCSGAEDLDTLQFPVSVLPLCPICEVQGAAAVLFVLEVVRSRRRREESQLGSDTRGQGRAAEQVTELWQREAVHLSQLRGRTSHRRRRPTLLLFFNSWGFHFFRLILLKGVDNFGDTVLISLLRRPSSQLKFTTRRWRHSKFLKDVCSETSLGTRLLRAMDPCYSASGSADGTVDRILEESRQSKRVILNLSHRKLKIVPLEISKLSFLKVLLLNNNSILMPPDEIAHLQQLECLSLEHNELTLIPSGIANLQSLSFLNLSYNKLGCLPSAVSNLKSLKELWLAHVGLNSFPNEVSGLHQLERLSLEGNDISSVGEAVENLSNLKWLSLARNHLTELGNSFKKLTNLRILNLQENCFQQFPQVLLGLKELTNLNLRRNLITTLPSSITDFLVSSNQFSKLDLRENRMQEQFQLKQVWKDLDFVLIDTWHFLYLSHFHHAPLALSNSAL